MNLLDSIDKSSYTLLFSDETEMSPYGASRSSNTTRGRSFVPGGNSQQSSATNNTVSTTTAASNGGVKSHTVLNMKTTLVNGSDYDNNCDNNKGDSESDDVESQEKKPLVSAEVVNSGPPAVKPVNSLGITTTDPTALSAPTVPTSPPGHSSYNLIPSSGTVNFSNMNKLTEQYNIGELLNSSKPQTATLLISPSMGAPVGSMNQQQHLVQQRTADPYSSSAGKQVSTGGMEELRGSTSNWGPDSFNSNLSTGSDGVNSYSEGQKVLPSTYFIKDYSNIFGNIANKYETEELNGEVAKLPINNTAQGNKMFLIGLSSNVDDNDDDEERDLMENEDQFQSATEEMGGDGDHDRGDQDPLLVRPPPKQNVFHQFIRSATKSTKNNRRPSRNVKHSSFGKSSQGTSSCSSRSALIKEVEPPHDDNDNGDDNVSATSSADGSRTGRRCSIGILLAAISCVFFATSALIVKISNLHPMELLAVRGTIQGILISPIVITSKNSFMGPSGSRSLLLARAVLGAVALVMGFASIHLIQLSDAATVIFTSPVFVSIFACLCLGEVCSWFDVSMIALTLVGVLLVSKPSFAFVSSGSWTGIVGTICGLIAAMLTALAFIVLRQLKQVHYSVVVFWFSTVLAMFGAILTIALDGFTLPRTWAAVMECIGIGFCGFMGQILLTKALQSENALPIAVTRTFDIVLAFFYQITLLHDTPDWYSYLGSVLVVSCVLLTAFRRWYKESITKRYQRIHKVPDDEPSMIDDNLHESSSSPPPPTHTTNHHNRQLHHQEDT